jgi:CPA1 family monovalent cation:H+ antiporter
MVLVLLLAVVVSRILARLLPIRVPLPILQIGIGTALSYLVGFEVRLEPDIFFLLFIAPLLFLDGWRISKQAFLTDWRPILTLAFGLVVFTVVGLGPFIHKMIPAIPLAVAFAVAAILSPTDAVAVSAISAGAPIPARLMHILEGEALLNDASGLVCFRFAVVAALTGGFSLSDALLSFLQTAAGGLLAGVVISFAASTAYHWFSRRMGEEPGTPILISLLIPFAAYLAAERLGVSGILAAAAAGVWMHYADLLGRPLAITRIRGSAVWEMLQLALNGVIFVLLGEQLPGVVARMPDIARGAGAGSPWWLLFYVAAITVALGVLRVVWIWASIEAARVFTSVRGEVRSRPTPRFLGVASLAGAKGAVTFAGILTLPVAIPDGSLFPARDLAIFLAMGVILLSLIMASIGLPVLAHGLQFTESLPRSDQEANARHAAAKAAIRSVEEARDRASDRDADIEAEAASRVIGRYQKRLDHEHASGDEAARMSRASDIERRLMLAALRAERDEYYRLRLSREIDDDLHRRLVREVDLMEASLTAPPQH